eukprot:COSAG02_NODE_54975_length_293_cov_0.773196_1_plen_62_part_10
MLARCTVDIQRPVETTDRPADGDGDGDGDERLTALEKKLRDAECRSGLIRQGAGSTGLSSAA